jgi:hypothetical protein
MKTFSCLRTILFAAVSVGFLMFWAPPSAVAQIHKMSKRQLRAATNKAERQAHRAARRAARENPEAGAYLDMDNYNMTPGESGRKTVKTNDGRDNYQFTSKGVPIVTEAPVLTNKRLRRKSK